VDRLLHEAGTDGAHILRAEIYLADMADFAAMNEVWDDWSRRATRRHGLRCRPGWRAGMEDRDRRHGSAVDRIGPRPEAAAESGRAMSLRLRSGLSLLAVVLAVAASARDGGRGRTSAWVAKWLHWPDRETSR